MIDPTIALVAVGLLSIACQFLAHKVKLPAILFLLIAGIIVGPVTGTFTADALFGDLLFPIVSLAVAIILFEGSLTLKFSDISGHGNMVRNLCTSGVFVTWATVTPAAYYFLDIPLGLAALLGAIVTVTGPTVIVPMLRTVRPSSKIGNILRWEGIIIDPIGALCAVLVFEFILTQQDALTHTFLAFGQTILSGLVLGVLSGYCLGLCLRHNLIPHYLQNTATLTIVLGAFAFSNALAHESGLLTVTIAGMILANMKNVDVSDILEFKETLSVLLISGLFILLATRMDFSAIQAVGLGAVIVVLVVLFIARPASVFVSAIGTQLNLKEKLLLSWIAPRGIVAAAVSALFALKLEAEGYPQAEVLVPMVFIIIIATVVIQSLTSAKVASLLGLRSPEPNGLFLFGGSQFSRELAAELQQNDIPVILADTNWDTVKEARMANTKTYFGNPMSEHAQRHLDLTGIGSALILSPYKQLNPLVMMHFEHELGKEATVLGLNTRETEGMTSHQVSESYAKKLALFDSYVTYSYLASAMKRGAKIKTTALTDEFSFENYLAKYENELVPLLYLYEGKVGVFSGNKELTPKSGWKIISLVLQAPTNVKEEVSPA
ncbi:cation:proton antiporter [Glaciecola siphonariae]|uniref:Cation:proton antiporter n=1 Tax=Glaciecola siphonariae TaxID=521012 RepID=A0ABV9LQK9_9ALTE